MNNIPLLITKFYQSFFPHKTNHVHKRSVVTSNATPKLNVLMMCVHDTEKELPKHLPLPTIEFYYYYHYN